MDAIVSDLDALCACDVHPAVTLTKIKQTECIISNSIINLACVTNLRISENYTWNESPLTLCMHFDLRCEPQGRAEC